MFSNFNECELEKEMKSLLTCVALAACCVSQVAFGGTKNLTFGWEDGTSTDLGFFAASGSGVVTSNVTSGSEIDYGTEDPPVPVTYDVDPFEGDRMLQITETPIGTSAGGPRVFIGFVENLTDGDTIEFSFEGYDPSDGRSPSILPVAVYTTAGNINGLNGFLTPFQEFAPGTGWLHIVADAAPDGATFPVDPVMVFDSDGGLRDSVILEARVFRPSAALNDAEDDDYNFFIDNMSVTVTSANENAQITLPDNSVTLVNSTSVIAGDYDDSGQVGQGDLDLVLLNWGATAPPVPGGWVNEQPTGLIGQAQLDGVLLNWGNTSLAANAVPEPTSFVLVTLAGLLVATRRNGGRK